MASYTGLSPKGPRNYVGKNTYLSSIVTRKRAPTSADVKQPETGIYYRTGSFWLVGENPTTGSQGDIWYLSKIVSNVSFWIRLSSGTGNAEQFTPSSGTSPVFPDGNENLNLVGTVGGGVTTIGSSSTITFEMESPFTLSDFIFETTSGARIVTISSLDGSSTSNNAILNLVTHISGGSPEIIFHGGSSEWVLGFDNINTRFSLSRSTILGSSDVIRVSNTANGGTQFVENVGIQSIASSSVLQPLTIGNTVPGAYNVLLINTSTADNTSTTYTVANTAGASSFGMGSPGWVSNPVLQGAAYWQTSPGVSIVNAVNLTDTWAVYVNGVICLGIAAPGGVPIVEINSGYLDLGGQTKVNSFQNASLAVNATSSSSLITIGSGQTWMFTAMTTNASADSTYRATAMVYGYANGSNIVTHLDTSKITFTASGNAISVANSGAANVTLIISGIRLY